MIENYTRLSSRMFTATVVGKDKNGRKITEGRETYKTPSGVYEIKDWARLVEKAAEADGLLPLLEQIKRHVKEYAWMKNASDFVFRVSEGRGGAPVFKLVAADGGVWKSQAVANVKAYLTEALKDIPDRDKITIIA